MRVVTTLPAATEIVYALGVEPAAVSHECDHPAAARARPTVVDTRIDPDASTSELSSQVATARAGSGLYQVDRDRLAGIEPDLIVAQGTCEVCAVAGTEIESLVTELGLETRVLTTHAHTLGEVFTEIRQIGRALDRRARAAALVDDLRARVDRIERTTRDIDPETRPRVAIFDWLDPVMVAGHWVPELVQAAGGTYGLGEPGVPAKPRDWAAIRRADPEVLVAAPCGFELDRAAAEATTLTGRPGWADIAAVRDCRIYAMDGHHYLNRPGPRLVDTLEFLAGLLHPDRFEAPPREAVRRVRAGGG